jgi:hypothetical protein
LISAYEVVAWVDLHPHRKVNGQPAKPWLGHRVEWRHVACRLELHPLHERCHSRACVKALPINDLCILRHRRPHVACQGDTSQKPTGVSPRHARPQATAACLRARNVSGRPTPRSIEMVQPE